MEKCFTIPCLTLKRIKISDSKAKRRIDDSMSSLPSSKYMIKLSIYMEKIYAKIFGETRGV